MRLGVTCLFRLSESFCLVLLELLVFVRKVPQDAEVHRHFCGIQIDQALVLQDD